MELPEIYSAFISFNHADKVFARTLYQAIVMRGMRVFFAPESLKVGDSHVSEINKALGTSRVGIVVWSKAASGSRYVEIELNVMHELQVYHGLRLFIVAIDDTPLPPLYTHLHRLTPKGSRDPQKVADAVVAAMGFTTASQKTSTPSNHLRSPEPAQADFRTLIGVKNLSDMECDLLLNRIQNRMKEDPGLIHAEAQQAQVEFQGASGCQFGASLNHVGLAAKQTVLRARYATEMIEIYQGNMRDAVAAMQTPASLMYRATFERQLSESREKMELEYSTLRECLDLFVTALWSSDTPHH